jgi:predicted lactoylglutathione lyase
VIVRLSADSRVQVNDLVSKALAASAQDLGESKDDGFRYMRGFRDLDAQGPFIDMKASGAGHNG